MNHHYLTPLFSPKSVAVIGASEERNSAGRVLFENIAKSDYQGEVYPVNPNRKRILGKPCYATVEDIPNPVEVAVIATPAGTVPDIVDACGRKGVKAALIISSGFTETGAKGKALLQAVLNAAKTHGVRILGPNCLGLMRPDIALNATYSTTGAKPGNIAFVSQSGALTNAILDWANANDVGFSSVITLGDAADVRFGEILDYLVWDLKTDSILLYIEGIHDARRFMSALRAVARVKPVIVVKAGRDPAGFKAAVTHSGAQVGADDVFDCALRRAGAVRVKTFVQFASAAKCLASRYRPCGNKLAIISNGGGPGIIASDWAVEIGIQVPDLSPQTLERLNQALPAKWSRCNPVDLCGGGTPEHYRAALTACMEDSNMDGVLVILTPQAVIHPEEAANVVIELGKQYEKPLITCWMGEAQVAASHQAFAQAKIPTFRSPELAVEAFSQIVTHHRNQQFLMQVPGPLSHHDEPDAQGARILIENVLAEKRNVLNETESKALLAAFRIPIANAMIARSATEAIVIAQQLGFPVAMKINSPDIAHKSEVGGVKLNIGNAQEVRTAFNEIPAGVAKNLPNARIDGVSIQPMINKPNGRELMLGIATDSLFGPVITFGAGGVMVEIMGDKAVTLPPLNAYLARDLIGRTRAVKMLGAFRQMPPADMDAVESVLLRVSEMVCELPWLKELDINPLIVDENGAIAVDARVVVDFVPVVSAHRYSHMAIYPYPSHLVQNWQLADGTDVTIRPVRPEDAELLQNFMRRLSSESRYFRFISGMQELSRKMLVRFTQLDYDREMALLAVLKRDGAEVELGAARYVTNPDGKSCEFALVVSDAWHDKGIGTKLMLSLIDVARDRGLATVEGEVLSQNHNMLKLMTTLGFSVNLWKEDPTLTRVVLELQK